MDQTEMGQAPRVETEAIHAWALDYDDPDEFPTQPTRMTPRRITSLGLAVSLVLIAMAGAVALGVIRQHERQEASQPVVAETVARPAPPTVTMTLPPPVTVTVQAAPASPTPTAAAPSGPTIGDVCHDRSKFATDPVSGQVMICDNYSEMLSKGEPLK